MDSLEFPAQEILDESFHVNDYEEGTLYVKVRKHWWQFWLPKQVVAGCYTKVGKQVIMSAFEKTWIEMEVGKK